MMNRLGLGLAVGAGYVLGRTKKMKLAFAVGTMVAGKRMHLSPRAVGDLLSQQMQDNPQFKEIGDQLRQDLRGVGKAASGALVERQIEGLADRLHGRTAEVRDQLADVAPDLPGRDDEEQTREADDEYEDEPGDAYEESSDESDNESDNEEAGEFSSEEEPAEDDSRARRKAPAKKAPAKEEMHRKPAAKKAPAKKTMQRKPAAKKAPAKKKAPGKKTAAAGSSARRAGPNRSKGGGDDG